MPAALSTSHAPTLLDSPELNFDTESMWQQLDMLQEEMISDNSFRELAVGTATGLTAAFSTGYVMWALRGGYLAAGMLSSLPSWRFIDPLPILVGASDQQLQSGQKEDSLAQIVDRGSTK